MKKTLMIMAMIVAVATITYSCKEKNTQEGLSSTLNGTESNIVKTFEEAKSNDDLVKQHFDKSGQYLSPLIFMEDSLYHINDSLCNAYYRTYCNEMMKGDSMMGGGMMGSDTMHGCGMMDGGMMGGNNNGGGGMMGDGGGMMGGGMMGDGGGMMGGDTMSGGGMMGGCGMGNMQSCMSDTTAVSKVFRELLSIRQAHSSHHPVKQ